ncbi:endo-1,4-beta-xylanase [Cellulomonas flavigena]|nr:endo-1,4-beta-xylanase [Cellulomonas flavigena]
MVGTTLSSASAVAPVVVVSAGFDDGTLGDLMPSGSEVLPVLGYVDEGAGKALSVTGREATWHTVQSGTGILAADVQYTFRARMKLLEPDANANGRFTLYDGSYTPVGATALSDTAWTVVEGTYTVPAGVDASTVKFAVEAGAWPVQGPPAVPATFPDFLLDDVEVTRAPAAAPAVTTVVSAGFDDGTLGDLMPSGSEVLPVLGYVDEGAGKALSVTGREATWHTVQSGTGILAADVQYTFRARMKLLEPDANANGRFTLYDGSYTPVGATALSDTAWTVVEGTYTVPAGVDASTVKFAVEAGAWPVQGPPAVPATFPDFLLDDVEVTRAAGGSGPVDPPADVTVLSSDFATGFSPWVPRVEPGVKLTHDPSAGRTAAGAMLVSGRTANWHGVQTPINALFAEGGEYDISAWVKLAPGSVDTTMKITVAETPTAYHGITPDGVVVTDDAWVELSGTYTRAPGVTGGDLYIEAAATGPEGAPVHADFLVDDVTIVGPPVAGDGWVPDLDGFVPGGAVNPTTTPVVTARPVEGAANRAALTFDDGPSGADTPALLDFLAENDIPATFCVIGSQITAEGGAALLRRIVDEGHTLCSHSTGWADMSGYTKAQVETDLKANLRIIRDALGDPNAPVPYFRAPNGEWGQTASVAVALGMQPLAVSNTINDWATQDEVELTDNLRAAMQPGRIVLVHDGGGDRAASVAATRTVVTERLADGWTFTLPQGGADAAGVSLAFDFEDGTLQGWAPRATEDGAATVASVEGGHDSARAAQVSDRVHQGQGMQYDVTGLLAAGTTYEFEAWIRFAGTPGDMTLSARTVSGDTTNYGNLVSITGVTEEWTRVAGKFSLPAYDTAAEIYFETAWDSGNPGNTSTFLVDDVTIRTPAPVAIQDLEPLKDTVPFPMGIAIDSRETQGDPGRLTQRHFNQYSAENHMKPEAWYDAERNFRLHPEAKAVMDTAAATGTRVYGHVLVWHSQTPEWFFQDEAGEPLAADDAGRAVLRERLRTHVFDVARSLSDEYGLFGSDTNPLVAWDVVNEVVSDGAENPDGLRRSEWFRILGEDFIDLSFQYADEAFNEEYAAPGTDRPVTLFINDYNTEQSGKQDRYVALVERLLARDVPIDGVGHQFHVSLSLPVSALEAAIERFEALPVLQAVTELDVATGTPVTDARLIDQGYFYRDAFDIFRDHADSLFSVTVWGLNDGRSWVNDNGAPLLFDDDLQAKPAYYGAAGQDLPEPIRTATVFGGEVALDEDATSAVEWQQLRLHDIGEAGAFQLRWTPDTLTVLADVDGGGDTLEVQVGDTTWTYQRGGGGDAQGVDADRTGGWRAVVHVPLDGATVGSTLAFDVRVVDGYDVTGWAGEGATGTLTLVEELSYLETGEATTAPVVDGEVDRAWAGVEPVTTAKQVSGTGTAVAEVRTLWAEDTLYVLAEVADADVDVTGSDPWIQDSVEVYVDAGNHKNGSYRPQDMQIRISAENVVSFGTGDEAAQRARVQTATARTDGGYVVELAVDLLDEGGIDTFHGVDFQVNDASNGSRLGITNWADPTGAGYQSTSRWGVTRLVSSEPEPGPATGKPAAPVLSHDNWDGDGQFTVTSTLWWGQNAHTLTLLENGTPIATQRVVDATPGAQRASFEVAGRQNGSYSYEVVATNQHGSTTTRALVVRVVAANPGLPVVVHDNWDGDGSYTVSMHMWWGTNADTYRLYENGVLVDEQTLTPNGRNAQHAGTRFEKRPKGTYRYTVELSNAAGTTTSLVAVPVVVWR